MIQYHVYSPQNMQIKTVAIIFLAWMLFADSFTDASPVVGNIDEYYIVFETYLFIPVCDCVAHIRTRRE